MYYKTLSRNGGKRLFVKTFVNGAGGRLMTFVVIEGIELVLRCGVLPIQTGRPYSNRFVLYSFFL